MKRGSSEAQKATQTTTVDGQALLGEMEAFLRRFIYLPNPAAYSAIPVWALYTHAYDAFDYAPRLLLWSPVPGSGKSSLLGILNGLVRNGHWELIPTQAGLFRNIEQNHPTLLLDEADKYLNVQNSGVNAILNGGHMKGVSITRNAETKKGYKPESFNLFGPVAYAMKGRKPIADLLDRSITINFQKAPPQAKLEKMKQAVHSTELAGLHERAKAWAEQEEERLKALNPEMPSELRGRIGDNWLPLFAIAEAAGGEWPIKLRDAARSLEAHRGLADSGLVLLRNILDVFLSLDTPWVSSQDLCDALNANENWQWGGDRELTPHSLARRLKPFEIGPIKARPDGVNQVRGYSIRQFEKVWEQYGISGETLGALKWAKVAGASNPIARALIQITY